MSTEGSELFQQTTVPRRSRAWIFVLVFGIASLMAAIGATLAVAEAGKPFLATPFHQVATTKAPDVDSEKALRKRAVQATSAIERVKPKGAYIVVDTYRNRLHMYSNGELVRSAICSTGTGRVLRDPRTGKQWVFDTPLGEREVTNKKLHPVWAKPDWAFIEEGYTPPPLGSNDRFDDASLGDYGLYMGSDGYIIHGTLFKTLLGRRVTHGCIRLGDEDLEFIYKHAAIGTRVYLY